MVESMKLTQKPFLMTKLLHCFTAFVDAQSTSSIMKYRNPACQVW